MRARAKPDRVHNLAFVDRDRGYRFTDRDPAMVELCALIDESGMAVSAISNEVSKATGGAYTTSTSTIYNWMNGKTKRPTNYTMTWVAYALGYERKWTKLS